MLHNLVISVHGWTKEIYASLAGAENGFEELIKAINLLKENNVKFGINVVISRYTQGEIERIINFLKSNKIKNVAFNIASPIVSRQNIDASSIPQMVDYKNQVMQAYFKCKENEITPHFLLIVPHCLFSEDELSVLEENESIASGCHVVHGAGVVFKANGAIAICTHLTDFEIAESTFAKDIINSPDNFLKFWNSRSLQEIRKKANCCRSNECHTCKRWSVCGGGCLLHWTYHTPEGIGLKQHILNNN